MIVVDTSALMAIVLDEAEAEACINALDRADIIAISAATMAEALLVAALRNVGQEMERLIDGIGCEIAPVSEGGARRVARAYARWGKGAHPAALNFGDCFAYALAEERNCSLLFVGADFSRTDVLRAQ